MPALVATLSDVELRRRFDEDEDEFEDGFQFDDADDEEGEDDDEFGEDEDELGDEEDLDEDFDDNIDLDEEPDDR
jgi:hypothetical protein